MKKITQFQKAISILMIFIILIQLNGCYSSRVVSDYVIHGENSRILVNEVVFSDGILSGKIDLNRVEYSDKNKLNIYVTSDSVIIKDNDLISLPVNNIVRIEQKKPGWIKSGVLFAGGLWSFGFIIFLISGGLHFGL